MQNGFTATCWQTTTDWSDLLQTGVASKSFADNMINISLLCIKSIAGPPRFVRYHPGLTWSDFSSDRLTVHMRLKLSQVKNFSRVFLKGKSWMYRVFFLTVPPNFQYQNEKQVAANQTTFSRNFQCKKAPRWMSKFFHFGTENGEVHPVYSPV